MFWLWIVLGYIGIGLFGFFPMLFNEFDRDAPADEFHEIAAPAVLLAAFWPLTILIIVIGVLIRTWDKARDWIES